MFDCFVLINDMYIDTCYHTAYFRKCGTKKSKTWRHFLIPAATKKSFSWMQFSKTELAIFFERASAPPRSSGTLPESMRLPWSCRLCRLCEPKVWYALCHSPRGSKQRPFIRGHIFTCEIRMKSTKRYAKMWQAQNKTLLHLLHSLHLLHCCILRIALFKSFLPSSSQPVFESINTDCVQKVRKVLLHFNG